MCLFSFPFIRSILRIFYLHRERKTEPIHPGANPVFNALDYTTASGLRAGPGVQRKILRMVSQNPAFEDQLTNLLRPPGKRGRSQAPRVCRGENLSDRLTARGKTGAMGKYGDYYQLQRRWWKGIYPKHPGQVYGGRDPAACPPIDPDKDLLFDYPGCTFGHPIWRPTTTKTSMSSPGALAHDRFAPDDEPKKRRHLLSGSLLALSTST